MTESQRQIRKKRILRYFILLFVVTLATLFLWRPILGHVLKKVLVSQLNARLEAESLVEELQFSIFPPALEIQGLQLKTGQGAVRYLGVDRLRIVPGLGPAFLGRLVIKRAEVSGLRLALQVSESKPQPRRTSFLESLNLPLRDLIQVELGKLLVDQIQFSIEWPAQNLRLSLDEGALEFRGERGEEVLSWKGSARMIREGRQILIPDVQLRAQRSEQEIRLTRFRLVGEESEAFARGTVFPNLSLKWGLNTELKGFEKVLLRLGFLDKSLRASGEVGLNGSLSGTWKKWEVQGKASGKNLSVANEKLGTLSGRFRATPSSLKNLSFRLQYESSKIFAEYSAGKEKGNAQFKVSGKIPYSRIEKLYQDPSIETHLRGDVSVSVEGTLGQKKKLEAKYKIDIPRLRFELGEVIRPFLPLELSSLALNGKLRWQSGKAFEIEGGQIEALGFSGTYAFRFDDKGSHGQWLAQVQDLGEVFAPEYRIRGSGFISGGIEITPKQYEILLSIDLPQLGLGKYPLASFDGDIVFLRQGTVLRNFALRNNETRVALQAGFGLGSEDETTLRADFSNLSLGWASKVAARKYPIVERVEGRSSGFLELNGKGETLMGKLEVDCDAIRIKEEDFDRAEIRMDFTPEGLRVNRSKVWRENASLAFEGVVGEEGFEDFKIDVEMVPLQFFSIPEETLPWMTHVQGHVELQGDSQNPEVKGEARIFRQAPGMEYSSVGKLSMSGVFDALEYRVDLLGRRFLAEGQVNAGTGEKFLSKGELQEFPLTPHFPEASSFLTGEFSLKGNASEWKQLNGYLAIDSLVARSGEWEVKSSKPARLDLKDGSLTLDLLNMEGAETSFDLNAEVSNQGLLSGNLSGKVELRILQFLASNFRRAEGLAIFRARLGGKTDSPEFFGEIDIQNGQFLVNPLPQSFENVNLNLQLAGGRVSVDQGVATVGGGEVRIGGDLFWPTKTQPMELKLEVETSRVKSRFPPWMPSTTSGTLQILGPISKPLLKGQFDIHRAVYRSEWDWKSKILSLGGTGRMDRIFRSDEENLELDLTFTSEGDSIEISNSIARGKLRGSIRLLGSDQRFGILGSLELASGEVEFLDNKFKLESGSISFEREDAVVPLFDLNAQTRVQDILILLDIRSEKGEIQAFLSSNPFRDETSIIALLTLGVDVDDLSDGSAGGSSLSGSILPSVLSGPVQSQLESGLKKAKLIDTLQFVPYYSEITNTSGLRLIVGKQLFPKVRLLYSTDLFDVGAENTVRVEQRLNENVSLQGSVRDNQEQSEDDFDLGVDFEFRLDF